MDPRAGYDDLVAASVRELESRREAWIRQIMADRSVERSEVDEAITEQLASWKKRLNGESSGREAAAGLVQGEGWWYDPAIGSDMAIYLIGMVKVRDVVREKGDVKTPVSAKAKAKDYLRKELPIGRYVGRLRIEASKLEGIKAV